MCTSGRDLKKRTNMPTLRTYPHNISVKICPTRKLNLRCRRISPHVTSGLINSHMPLEASFYGPEKTIQKPSLLQQSIGLLVHAIPDILPVQANNFHSSNKISFGPVANFYFADRICTSLFQRDKKRKRKKNHLAWEEKGIALGLKRMSSEVESWKNHGEDLSCGHLLRDIEEISKALYLHKTLPKALNSSPDHRPDVAAKTRSPEQKSEVVIQDLLHKDKKSSIWNWKPLKALTHIRNHRFNCRFFLHVHVIEGLPSNFDDLRLCVTWMRKGDVLTTCPARVFEGMAKFEETLMHQCTVYGSRNGSQHSSKYDPKLSLLHVSVIGAPALDIGKHWIDLTRLLPLTLEELEEDKRCSGNWTTSFKLSGRAKGAMLNVSFGFSLLGDNSFEPGCYVKVPNIARERRPIATDHLADFDGTGGTNRLHVHNSVQRNSSRGSRRQSQSLDLQFLEEIFPNRGLPQSVTHLYWTPDEGQMGNSVDFNFFRGDLESLTSNSGPSSESGDGSTINMFDDTEFTVIEQCVEVAVKDQEKVEHYACQSFDSSVIETIDVAEIFEGDGVISDDNALWNSKLEVNGNVENENAKDDIEYKESSMCTKEPTGEELDSLLDISNYYELENYRKNKSSYKGGKLVKSLSLEDVAESIANDFLNMLSIEQYPDDEVSDSGLESLRDFLLGQFEENTPAWGNSIFDIGVMAEQKSSCLAPSGCSDDFYLSLAIQEGERTHGTGTQSLRSKRNAKTLENLETEALMHEWGLNEKAFQNSPCTDSGGFGSPVYIPAEEPLKLPSLGEGLGPIIQTKDGGFLRSMNPLLFRNSKSGTRLIMQVSAPILLPAAMGFSIMDILQCWASEGVEKMSAQANELMPLEDITGKTIQEVVSETESRSDAFKRWTLQHGKLPIAKNSDTLHSCSNCKEIESGLKIQSNMPDQEAPSSIGVQCAGKSASSGMSVKLGGDFLDVDELIEYSLSLEEWMRLDAGDFDIEDKINERIVKILAAHQARSIEWCHGQLSRDDEISVFGKNFTMGLKVQLRNPFRNYEMVGYSMLALIQVGRVYSPLQREENGEEDDQDEQLIQERINFKQKQKKIHENHVPWFKILDVHLAGLNVELGDKQLWGTRRQLQSGSRWLFSSGMIAPNKHSFSNSNTIVKSSTQITRKACPRDLLWSISSNIQGEAATWDKAVALNIHVRNPDIIFPNEFVRFPRE
ncbi:hypothetical protein Adt_14157 [Abeliophyllum distichum]|uniref:C2 NT-type domain-containing protein n=1 Tax=Abeliophyllum distichum TaxID=126358 RepID=A0ABD1TZS3_9LAMI